MGKIVWALLYKQTLLYFLFRYRLYLTFPNCTW